MFYFLLAMPGGEGAGALPNSSADTSNVRGALFALPPPPEKWKEFEQAWKNYSIAMKLHQEPEAIQVATLLSVVGAEVWNVFAMFTDWASDTDQNKIQPVLQKFAAYCQPLKNVPFERYKFYSRMQESGESYDHYRTALRQLAERCEFESITPNQILRDKLVFGIRDSKVCERLLHEKNLSLEETDEICHSHETMVQQMRVVGDAGLSVADAGNVNAVSKKPKRGKRRRSRGSRNANTWGNSCEFCGREHDLAKRENCPAFGRSCNKCGKKNHFANVCFGHAPKPTTRTHPVYCFEDELSDEVFGVEEISAVTLDDSQLVTLKLESGNYLRFQPDTGAQCNVFPLHLYKKATKDADLCNVTPVSTAIISYWVLQFLSSGNFVCVHGVEISDVCLTAIWLTATKSDLFLAGKRA